MREIILTSAMREGRCDGDMRLMLNPANRAFPFHTPDPELYLFLFRLRPWIASSVGPFFLLHLRIPICSLPMEEDAHQPKPAWLELRY